MSLSLATREVGRVTIVHCNGRIVAGSASDSLREHVTWLLRDRRSIVLHLGEVGFIDSSGLGTMVRALTTTRQAHGDLKLCNVPEFVRKVLEMSRLTTIFDAHESEEKAIAAFYRPGSRAEAPVATGHSVLCLDSNADVLAYLRELLRRAGYDVQSSSRVADALLLMRVSQFDLLLIGSGMKALSPPAFQEACSKLPVIELGGEFSTSHAGEAGAQLLETIAARLHPTTPSQA
ncbi:MAG: anti-sigma factor antagonist [Terriglobales bacterium]